jgi:2-polyprenyl-3-methyl-5-hydroxy-6-metoxy-1,4-benzoquinol methylase
MIGTNVIDPNMNIDWGKTSEDYAKYRPGPPQSFYKKLSALDVGLNKQKILDIGTGTGVIAREFAKQGCEVTGTDISKEQINMARSLAEKDNLEINFLVSSSEEINFPKNSFDVIIANQCFLYFDVEKVKPIFEKILKPNGVLVLSHFSWMPFLDKVAKKSEELILDYNPNWTAHSYKGDIRPKYPKLESHFHYKGFFVYDEGIPFTKDSWLGRIRACRGVGASMDLETVQKFNHAHKKLLDEITDEEFNIIHRLDAHIFSLN